MKKLLVLAGKPIGTLEIIQRAKELGFYTICTDFLPSELSVGKRFADEIWDISTNEVQEIATRCRKYNVDGILTGVHEFNINRMLDICAMTGMPCYCTKETWKYCDNKLEFKKLCIKNNIRVAKTYSFDQLERINYPVIVKPVDGSGSRGFHICHNSVELDGGYNDALNFSPTKKVLIEEYIRYDSVIIHYTIDKGTCIYSGMSDKISARFKSTGAPVMGIQFFPSSGEKYYLDNLNQRVCRMFEEAGFQNGPIWIEAFFNGKDTFIFNEMGYRFGGSLTYYPVYYFHQINQLDALLHIAMNEPYTVMHDHGAIGSQHYCILPIHIRSGEIAKIIGEKEVRKSRSVFAYVPVHFQGDKILEWGSAQQVFCYLHILFNSIEDLKRTVGNILTILRAETERGENLLYTLFDVNRL